MARSGGRHIVRNILIGLGAFVVFIIVISEIVSHTGGSSKATATTSTSTALPTFTIAQACTAIRGDVGKPDDDNWTWATYDHVLALSAAAGPSSQLGKDALAAATFGKDGLRKSPQFATVLADCQQVAEGHTP